MIYTFTNLALIKNENDLENILFDNITVYISNNIHLYIIIKTTHINK